MNQSAFMNYEILEIFEAIYTDSIVGVYKNNPYIEALPPMLERVEVLKLLASFPDFSEEERFLSTPERKLMVQNLFDFYYPTERTLEMYEKMTALICSGYIPRNPFSKEFNQQAKRIVKGKYYHPQKTTRKSFTSNNSITVIGISGIGKTSSIEQVTSLYPQAINHTEYKGMRCSFIQLVHLKLECPYDGSIPALCRQFFFEITKLFGENSFSYHLRKDMNTKEYLEKMKLVVHQLGLGMLIIDEVQNLREAKGLEQDQMLNFFVTLRNELSIPVVLVGTPKTYPVLQGDFRNSRRGVGQGDVQWGVLKEDDPYWKRIVKGMWRYQWTSQPTELTPEIEKVLYDETQGITDVLIKLYMVTQLRAMDKKEEIISPELIRKTAQRDFGLIQPMIKALRNNDLEALSHFEDVRPPDMEQLIQQHILELSKKEEIVLHRRMLKDLQKQKVKTLRIELLNALLELGYPKTRSKVAVSHTINKLGSDKELETYIQEAKIQINLNASKKKQPIQKMGESDLRNNLNHTETKNTYKKVKDSGLIPDVSKELGIGDKSDS